MKFWEQFLLDLVSPVVGTALIGSAVAVITRRNQDRRLDRQIRLSLVSRVSEIVYAIHTELSFYERWIRHSRPCQQDRDTRRNEVDEEFIKHRTRLGALQTEIDAYYGKTDEPGILLHRLTDLIMLRYAIILELPDSQVTEMVRHLGQPGHSGLTTDELTELLSTPKPSDTQAWAPAVAVERSFTESLHDTVNALLATKPISAIEGFKSRKMLTAYDQASKPTNPLETELRTVADG
jgi:hypothetical protein